jgi:opacity protein-like surface antigen
MINFNGKGERALKNDGGHMYRKQFNINVVSHEQRHNPMGFGFTFALAVLLFFKPAWTAAEESPDEPETTETTETTPVVTSAENLPIAATEPDAAAKTEGKTAVNATPVAIDAVPENEATAPPPQPALESPPRSCRSRRCGRTPRPTGTFFLQGGMGVFDLDSLNDRLSPYDYSALENRSIPLGFGITMHMQRIRAGIDWNWLWNHRSESADEDLQLSIRRRYWLVRYGVDVIQWKGLSVYPLFGIGSAWMHIDITRQSGASFSDVLASPARDSRLSQTSLLLDASLGIDYRFVRRETERRKSWMTVGLRGGYLFQPYAGAWRSSMAEIHDGPRRSFQGPVVQLQIGFSSEKTTSAASR